MALVLCQLLKLGLSCVVVFVRRTSSPSMLTCFDGLEVHRTPRVSVDNALTADKWLQNEKAIPTTTVMPFTEYG